MAAFDCLGVRDGDAARRISALGGARESRTPQRTLADLDGQRATALAGS